MCYCGCVLPRFSPNTASEKQKDVFITHYCWIYTSGLNAQFQFVAYVQFF